MSDPREVAANLRFTRTGIFNSLVFYFSLNMDDCGENGYTSGLENEATHWDLPTRFLPVELRVRKGQALRMTAHASYHNVEQLRLHQVPAEMIGEVGVHNLLYCPQFNELSQNIADKLAVVIEAMPGYFAASSLNDTTSHVSLTDFR